VKEKKKFLRVDTFTLALGAIYDRDLVEKFFGKSIRLCLTELAPEQEMHLMQPIPAIRPAAPYRTRKNGRVSKKYRFERGQNR